MHLTDPIADMLTRIRNANIAKHTSVAIPFSKIKESIANILKNEGYISEYEIKEEGTKKDIVVTLKTVDGEAVIKGLKRISKPGRRVYSSVENLPKVLGMGITFVTTAKNDEEGRALLKAFGMPFAK